MEREREESLLAEQTLLKVRLTKLISFINSKDFYQIDETQQRLLNKQRIGMEIYLNALTTRIFGKEDESQTCTSDSFLPLLLMSFLNPWGNNTPNSKDREEKSEQSSNS